MAVSFSYIPNDVLQPLFYAEVSNAKAAGGTTPRPSLLVGQGLGTGFTAGVPIRILSSGHANALFRPGSMLARMVRSYLANDPICELWVVPFADLVAGVAATGTLHITGTATAAGVLALYLGGQRLFIPIASGDTATVIGGKIQTALGVDEATAAGLGSTFPVIASNSTGTVTFTARHKGAVGNSIDVRVNYLGAAGSEALPPGIAITELPTSGGEPFIHLTSGAGDPDLSTIGAILGDRRYSFVGNPYTAAPALTKWQLEFADNPAGRWGYARRLYGGVWSALNDTAVNLAAFSTANDPHHSIFGIEGCPNPASEIAAAYCAASAASLRVDPARPLNTLVLNGILAPHPFDQFTYTDRNLILGNGITTPIIDSAGNVRIQRAITTYTKNAYGAADASFRDVTTPYTLDFLLTEMENLVTNQYGRVKLVNDGTPVAPGMPVVTPSAIKNAIVAAYQGWERLAIVENSAVFAKLLRVERDQTDPTRVNVYFPPDLANGLMVFAALAEFRLQYSPSDMAAA